MVEVVKKIVQKRPNFSFLIPIIEEKYAEIQNKMNIQEMTEFYEEHTSNSSQEKQRVTIISNMFSSVPLDYLLEKGGFAFILKFAFAKTIEVF